MEKTIPATLVFLVRHKSVWLARKTRKIGVGCYTGYGGVVKDGETILNAACREFREESGYATVESTDLRHTAICYFHNLDEVGGLATYKVYVFVSHKWKGDPLPTEEMEDPHWYPKECIEAGYVKVMPADYYWLPKALKEKKVVVHAWYGPEQKTLVGEVEVREVENFDEE